MALTHLVLLLLTNAIAKWKNGSALQNSSAILVNISQHIPLTFYLATLFKTNHMRITDGGQL